MRSKQLICKCLAADAVSETSYVFNIDQMI